MLKQKKCIGLYRQTTIAVVMFTAILASSYSISDEQQWKASKQKNGISTFTTKIAGSKYKAVKGETTLDIPLAKLVAVINDADACPEWADMCKKSYVHKQVSNSEAYIYTLNDLPWPVKDREVLAHVVWSKNSDGVITMNSTAVLDTDIKSPNTVQIETANARWEFTPLSDQETLTRFEIHMDPNGQIPGWLLNRLVLNSPFTTFKSLAEQASKEKYNDAVLTF